MPTIKPIPCPFTGETLTAVSALRPDVAVIHAQRADRTGNVQLWGITGVQKEAVLASARSVVTVEEIVDELDPRPGAVVLPGWTVTFVAQARGGAHPSYALGYSVRDNDYYVAWDAIARDRETFTRWLDEKLRRMRGGHDLHRGRDDDGVRRPGAAGRHDLFRRHRAAQLGREPGPRHARAVAGADLRVGHDRRQAGPAAAVHRRRHAGRDGGRGGQRPGDLQLLAAARPHRRRLPRRRPDRQVRQHQHHRDRRGLRQPQGAAARRGRRAGDRRLVP